MTSSRTEDARTAPTTRGSSGRGLSPAWTSTSTWLTWPRPTSLQVWMPSPSATVTPLLRSTTDTAPRTRDRIPSAVQKNAAKLGSASSG